jgi:hypothetical protein
MLVKLTPRQKNSSDRNGEWAIIVVQIDLTFSAPKIQTTSSSNVVVYVVEKGDEDAKERHLD